MSKEINKNEIEAQLFYKITQYGGSEDLESQKEEFTEMKKVCARDNEMSYIANIYTVLSGYDLLPSLPLTMRKGMARGMFLAQAISLHFNEEGQIGPEEMFISISQIEEQIGLTKDLTKAEKKGFYLGVNAELALMNETKKAK